MSFAENLQTIRKKNGLTQEDLAEMLGVSRQAVSKWEQGDGYPEVEKLLDISGKLGVSLDSLMGLALLDSALAAGDQDNTGADGQDGAAADGQEGAAGDASGSPAEMLSYVPSQIGDDPLNFDEDPERETPEAKRNRVLLGIALVCVAVIVLLFLSGLK